MALITDVKHLSSYNWIEASRPTIAVPGSPPLWSAPKRPKQLKKDSGLTYVAQNAARHPDSPLEPLFRALYTTNPSFDISSVDIVTDRNNVRKLLSFVNPSLSKGGLEPFAIGVEIVGNTAIFCREEAVTHEIVGPNDFRGFGHEFEKAYTTEQISGSTGHHRIISYRFGGLNFLVRHETDGYVGNDKESGHDHLSNMLGSLSLSSSNSHSTPHCTCSLGSKLTVKREGQVVSRESTLEIKTRVAHKPLQIHEVAPQLWISRTPKLVRAYHQKGTFEETVVEDVMVEVKKWEERHQEDLRKLAGLIRKIIEEVKERGGSAIVRCDGQRKLAFQKSGLRKMLPKDLYAKWDNLD